MSSNEGSFAMGLSNRISHRQLAAGFTLIEVMIVVAIIGILAGSPTRLTPTTCVEARSRKRSVQLSSFRNRMEQYYQDNRNYGTGTTCATDASANTWNGFAATQYFTFCCVTNNSNQNYTITATGQTARPATTTPSTKTATAPQPSLPTPHSTPAARPAGRPRRHHADPTELTASTRFHHDRNGHHGHLRHFAGRSPAQHWHLDG